MVAAGAGTGWRNLVRLGGNFAQIGRRAVRPSPVGQRHAALEHRAGLERIRRVPPAASRSRGVGILRRTAFLDGQQRQVRIAPGVPRRARQRRETEFGRRVGMLQRIDQLGRQGSVGAGGVRPAPRQGHDAGLFRRVLRGVRRATAAGAAPAQEVVDQGQAAAFTDRQDLVYQSAWKAANAASPGSPVRRARRASRPLCGLDPTVASPAAKLENAPKARPLGAKRRP